MQNCYSNRAYILQLCISLFYIFFLSNLFFLHLTSLFPSPSSSEPNKTDRPPTTQFSNPPPPNPVTYHHHHHYKIAIHSKPTKNSKENQITYTRTHNRDVERERSDRDQLWQRSVVVGLSLSHFHFTDSPSFLLNLEF